MKAQAVKQQNQKTAGRQQTATAPRLHAITPLSSPPLRGQRKSCACGGGCPRCQVQPKLAVSQPNDVYEQEADRVADQIMRMPAPSLPRTSNSGTTHVAPAPTGEQEKQGLVQRKVEPAPDTAAASVPDNFLQSLGSGRPLDPATRTFFEPRFGVDFSAVRIHTNTQAAESARAVNALAYTVGQNVVFNSGQYAPHRDSGKRLLAHELTHVIQQDGSRCPDVQRQVIVPAFRDCTPAITGIGDSNERLEAARLRAREFVGAALGVLDAAPAAGTTYGTALNRHFIAPIAADRAVIEANYRQILGTLAVNNYICNSNNICGGEQAFWISQDDLVHVCRPFWDTGPTCRAIILIHEGAHDIGVDAGIAHPPNRGSANYPAGNTAPPGAATTAGRITNPDAYAFFAAHIWRSTDTGTTCF